ncbi:MAG: O-antigen ligase family protein [Patescibacteria group bacterium]
MLGLSAVWGVWWGIVRGNGFGAVFFDANAWLYFLMAFPLLTLVSEGRGELFLKQTATFVLGACLANALLTLALFHIFAHQYTFTPTLYQWVRGVQLGEITFIRPGAWRVFLQSQVWLLFAAAWYFIVANFQSVQKLKVNLLLLSVVVSALFISFSRSYWIGLAALFFSGTVLLLRNHVVSWKRIIIVVIGGVAGAIVLTITFQRLPPIPAGIPLRERLSMEAAGSSRMNQLYPLLKAISKHPILGSGFGAAVTYQSTDPRIVARSPGGSGMYTTSAFEWGYLDIWLKIGLVGLASYLWLLLHILNEIYKECISLPISNDRGILVRVSFLLTLFCALIAVMSVNITSPYLNHPLGIGMVLLGICVTIINGKAYITE